MTDQCILYDKVCNDCGECDACDLEPKKTCDNCGKCLESEKNFRSLNIKEFMKIKEK